MDLKTVTIELPGIKALSRNQTTGHWFNYAKQLAIAENWMHTFGKAKEFHFTGPVDVVIEAYYNIKAEGLARPKIADPSNIDDKIFVDTLIRYKKSRANGKVERPVWFIEDDSSTYMRMVSKISYPSTENKVVITISEVNES